MDKRDTQSLREHINVLREEIAQIRVANRLHRKERGRRSPDTQAYIERRSRLAEIAGELASLSSGTSVRKSRDRASDSKVLTSD